MKQKYNLPCNIAQTLNIIGDRWTLLMIHEIMIGNNTFNEIKRALNGISANVLSERLKLIESQGLIQSELYSEHPPRYKYTLTKSGEDLEHTLHALVIWGASHLDPCYKKLVNSKTGEEVKLAYYSTTTGEIVHDVKAISIDEDSIEILQD